MDGLREEMDRRLLDADRLRRSQLESVAAMDEDVARAGALVRELLDQMNRTLLGGRGSIWDAPARWGLYLWELWWERPREERAYLVISLLRDSRGTAYLKVHGRRLALQDAALERRLQQALRAAFLEPRTHAPRARVPTQRFNVPRPAAANLGGSGGGLFGIPSVPGGSQRGDQELTSEDDRWARGLHSRRRRPVDGGEEK
jgi:hypothetical protein